MISKEMTEALNDQINKEVFSAYLYQSMGAYAAYKGLKGFASWFQVQVQEELSHAQKIYNYVMDQGERVILKAINQPETDFESPLQLFEKTLEHEKLVTASITSLAKLAQSESDFATSSFLQWFITEQVEEEASAGEILDKIKIISNDGAAMYLLDKELGARIFTPPA